MKKKQFFENFIHGIFLVLGLITVGCVLLISVYLIISGIPAILSLIHIWILPWREEPTPYHVWVSEIMLQQTRVEAVKPYYDRFMKALPDIRSLSQAEEEKLLKLWEGLGYYNRVRNMKKAAEILVDRYGEMCIRDSVCTFDAAWIPWVS